MSNDRTIAKTPRIVTRAEWLASRKALLEREKRLTKERDALAAARRELPMVKLEADYVFEEAAPGGTLAKPSLADLFDGRPQLLVYHFMFDPSWSEGCKSCSWVADNFERSVVHLAARGISLVAISRAPVSKFEPFKKRMGWSFRWASSHGTRFNYDFGVSFEPDAPHAEYNYEPAQKRGEAPGLSVFVREPSGEIFHTYSTYGRGLDTLIGTYGLIDLTPVGRDESALSYPMAWVRHRDRYEGAEVVSRND